jgi:type VI secretion system protein ImpH
MSLFSHAERHQMLAAVLEMVQRAHGTTPDGERCFFPANRTLVSPPGEVQAARPPAGRPVGELVLALFGVSGPNGALPYNWTEELLDRPRTEVRSPGEAARQALLDCLNHLLTASRLRDHFLGHLGNAYLGARGPDTANQLIDLAERMLGLPWPADLPRELMVHYFPLLREAPSHVALELLMTDYFGVPFHVRPFQRVWRRLTPGQARKLGRPVMADPLGGLTLCLGPLDRARFDEFLPGGTALRPLLLLARLFVGHGVCLDVRLELAAGEDGEMILGPHPRAARIDYTSWPAGRPGTAPGRRFGRISRAMCEAVEAGWKAPPGGGQRP